MLFKYHINKFPSDYHGIPAHDPGYCLEAPRVQFNYLCGSLISKLVNAFGLVLKTGNAFNACWVILKLENTFSGGLLSYLRYKLWASHLIVFFEGKFHYKISALPEIPR